MSLGTLLITAVAAIACAATSVAAEPVHAALPQIFFSNNESDGSEQLELTQVSFSAPITEGSPWWQELAVTAGLDGSKQPQDFGVNALFGGRISAELGLPVWQEAGIGAQAGIAFNSSSNAVAVFDQIGVGDHRNQLFLTLGLFQRSDQRVTWAVAYDFLWQDYYSSISLGQFRGSLGYLLNDRNEIGIWGTARGQSDNASVAGVPVGLRSVNQINIFWRHLWPFGADTMCWIGACDGHSRDVLVFPPAARQKSALVFGSALDIPLSNSWALTGQANFLTPADSGTVDAFLGLTYYFGGTHKALTRRQFSPVLPVANNSYFAVDLRR